MNKLIILALLLALAATQTYSITQCTCSQLLSQSDCQKNGCSWDTTKSTCGTTTTPVVPPVTYAAYCDSFAEADCPKAKPCTTCGTYAACAWDSGKCVQFTGCTAYAKTTDSDCQAISNRCITDGTHCVEVDACSTYAKQLPCVKNALGTLCYWDTTTNVCVDANTCDKLPTSFTTDAECRGVISTCTTKTGGGCIDSGTVCGDQLLEIQCVWNKLKNQKCYWDGAICKNKTCDAAPLTLTTDDGCKQFLDDKTCTTKTGGGCITRTICTGVIQAACVTNASGGDCYWNTLTSQCVEKICANAPTSMTTNTACIGFAPTPANGCITKSGGGCIANGACQVAIQSACSKNSSGFDCIWDTTCKEKTCANAPITNTTHELCTSYLSTCTTKTGGGCQTRTCANAPTSITTNEACETYLPGSKCITVAAGGCITNTTCAAIVHPAACVKDSSNNVCFYDTTSSSCKDKTCANAPSTNITHDLCQAFLPSCTVNSATAPTGCVTWTCENALVSTICTQDITQKPCIWKGKCYKKQCALAPSSTSTHNDCYAYLNSCTLSNTGAGCVPIPLKCEAITIEAPCVIRQGGSPCGWTGTNCIDKGCITAPKTTTTTTDCAIYKTGCVSANPGSGGIVAGCIDLPTTCAARLSLDNCSIGSTPNCLWNTVTLKCVEKTCDIATIDGTPGKVVASDTNCNSFLSGCLVSNDSSKCIAKVTSCSTLTSSANCLSTSKVSGSCFWNGSTCVDRTCTNINRTSHANCNAQLTSCTVNATSTGCMNLATACSNYTISDQCNFNSTNKLCVWTGTLCRNATCYDADNTSSYNTNTQCAAYAAVVDTCTVLYKVGGQGCVPRASVCTDYYVSTQCYKTLSNTTANNDCVWVNNGCYPISTWATGDCTTFRGTQASCELYRTGCTNVVGAISTTLCTFDCTKKTGSGLTHANCQTFNTTCTTTSGATTCQLSQSTCGGYTATGSTACTYTTSGTRCFWYSGACIPIATASADCLKVTGSGLTHAICSSYNSGCTMASATACQLATSCATYASSATCTYNSSGAQCFWYSDGTNSKCVDITSSSDCAKITGSGLTHTQCQVYDGKCTNNSGGTACQLISVCSDITSSASCVNAGSDKCYWNSAASPAACIKIVTVATDCALVLGSGLTHTICNAYNAGCTVNLAGTACQENKATCNLYTTSANCSLAAVGVKKCWWYTTGTAACIEIATAASDCAKVTGTGLTHATCQTYNTGCTVNTAQTACSVKATNCSTEAVTACNNSQAGDGVCVWDAAATPSAACILMTTSTCGKVTGSGLTHASCQAFDTVCTAASGGAACVAITACGNFTTSATCTNFAAVKCYWNAAATPSAACIPITTVASDCVLVTGTGLTDTTCGEYNSGCVANVAKTTCQKKEALCATYAITACTTATNGKCYWNAAASPAICMIIATAASECALVTGTGLTDDQCNAYLPACTANSTGTACQEAQVACSSYTTYSTCSFNVGGFGCIWYNSGTADTSDDKCMEISSVTDCAKVTGSGFTDDTCKVYNSNCKAASATACYLVTQCSHQPSSSLCLSVGTTKCFWYNSASCIAITTPSTDCAKVTGSGLTYDQCQLYNTGCSVNRAGTACIAISATCASYTSTMANCVRSTAGICVSTTTGDVACQAATLVTTCEGIFLGAGYYNDVNCLAAKSGCTNNSTTGCTARTCANIASGAQTHTTCNTWLNTCTVNSSNNGCATMNATCSAQAATASACLRTTEGQCVISGTACVKMTCDTASADSTHNDDSECSTYLSTCTVARTGGCQPRAACTAYKSALHCKFNTTGASCFWNPNLLTCVDLSCGNVEATTSYDTHTECVGVSATLLCTVRATNGAAVAGCMARGSCSSYTIEDQCRTNSNNGDCVWNTNLTTPACQDKACTTAVNTTATHADCYSYYSVVASKMFCTVVATPNVAGGAPTLGGCQQTAACSTYITEEQCKINANGDPCGWNGTVCADKSCATAQSTVNTDTLCRAYLSTCTVADSGSGCIEIPVDCTTLGSSGNCISNKAGSLCYWTGTACQTRTCENAPDATATADECNTYLAGCTLDTTKCKTKICEDFVQTTDALCRSSLGTCTTDGTKCVTRGTCYQALAEAGCVTSSTGLACQWIPVNGTTAAYCTVKSCATAPVATYTTETQCAGYFTNCTTKLNGGCVTKTTCAAANVEGACTTAIDGTVCQWDTNACRNKDCQDFSGTTHSACQALRAGCTVGANGKCAKVKNCEDTTIRSACIEGTNGPCLWVNGYPTTDGSTGACFRYAACKSLAWTSNTLCKLASNKCTTDGSKCVGISLCSETNITGGCVTGYDGDCIQSIASLASTGPAVCKPYTSCADAFYLTHTACQTASSKCTTNGSTGCIPLAGCSSYAQAGCVFNNVGVVYSSGAVTSTGDCTWDTTALACRDENCQDLVGTTHSQCYSQLSTCTSDGTNCLVKGNCSTYQTQTACAAAMGSDGTCYWEAVSATNTTAKCRLMTCSDIANGTSLSVCQTALSSCVSNGTNCINKANCQTYTSKTACNSAGSDGICVFAASTAVNATAGTGSCSLMTGCSVANNDQTACTAAKDRCKWVSATTGTNTTTASSCATHTCASYQATNGVCSRYLSWDKKTQQICTTVNATCTATDPSTLPSADCFSLSGYTYTWNSATSKCGVCTAVVATNNTTTTNNTNATGNTTTTSGYILGFASVVLGYLVF